MTERLPGKITVSDVDGQGSLLCCPACIEEGELESDAIAVTLTTCRYVDTNDNYDPVMTVTVGGSCTRPEVGDPHGVLPGGSDRRRGHAFALEGYCEMCGARFRFAFQRHKGVTVLTVTYEFDPDNRARDD